jgi:Ca2+-binding EF-hand superfamily protein
LSINIYLFNLVYIIYLLFDFADEFHRAVKICTGTSLSKHLVQTVFAIFDEDGDGQLSYREFIAIMKDRLNRGFKVCDSKFNFIDDIKNNPYL